MQDVDSTAKAKVSGKVVVLSSIHLACPSFIAQFSLVFSLHQIFRFFNLFARGSREIRPGFQHKYFESNIILVFVFVCARLRLCGRFSFEFSTLQQHCETRQIV